MNTRLSFLLGAALTMVFGGPNGALAQPLPGGLPTVEGRVTALEAAVTSVQASITALQAQNASLQSALGAETAARLAAESALQTALSQEVASRASGDAGLQAALNQEAATRASRDAALQTALNTERSERTAADTTLTSEIGTRGKAYFAGPAAGFLPNGDRTVILSLDLPAGSFFMVAKTDYSNIDHDTSWGCHLCIVGDICFEGGGGKTETSDFGFAIDEGNVALASVITLDAPRTVTFDCQSGKAGSNFNVATFTAISVAR